MQEETYFKRSSRQRFTLESSGVVWHIKKQEWPMGKKRSLYGFFATFPSISTVEQVTKNDTCLMACGRQHLSRCFCCWCDKFHLHSQQNFVPFWRRGGRYKGQHHKVGANLAMLPGWWWWWPCYDMQQIFTLCLNVQRGKSFTHFLSQFLKFILWSTV